MNLHREARPAEILLVEDNEDDVYLTRRAFGSARFPVNLHHVDNGAKCLAFLRRQGEYAQAPAPDLVLLDINMPVMNGREVLAAINADSALRHLAIVVLTTSAEQSDITAMYQMRCNSYIAKPVDFDQFVHTVQQLAEYWLELAILPSGHH
jgi:two-component system response regulator